MTDAVWKNLAHYAKRRRILTMAVENPKKADNERVKRGNLLGTGWVD
jgi:hypothetical protein